MVKPGFSKGPAHTRVAAGVLVISGLAGSGAAHAAELVAANGVTGAGTRSDGSGRAWAELGVSALKEEAVTWVFVGAGLRLAPWLEVEAQLPIGHGIVERRDSAPEGGGDDDDGGLPAWLGNPYFGVNLLGLREPDRRWRVGAGFTLPITGVDEYGGDVALLPLRAGGRQDPHLWQPGGASLVGRGRFELDASEVTLSFDLAVIVTLRVLDYSSFPSERITVLVLQPAVELASYVSPDTLVGARLPLVWGTLPEDEPALSIVPFLRQELGGGFFAEAQLTVNVVGPDGLILGDDGPVWGAQLGLGARL